MSTIAIRMLQEDPSRAVRQQAAGLLGPSVRRRSEVCYALELARDHDPEPIVRKIAGWCTPVRKIYHRLLPTPAGTRET